MKLGRPVIEFRGSRRDLQAKAVTQDRWYRVRGITRTLNSIARRRRGVRSHNMICVDLYARFLSHLVRDRRNPLGWLSHHLAILNAPEDPARKFEGELRRLLAYGSLNFESCRRAWDRSRMSRGIGNAVDAQCKDVFNGKKAASETGPVSRLLLAQLEALRLKPICAGLKVAGVPTPDRGGSTYHNGCTRGCGPLPGRNTFYTEVDLLAHDATTDTVALLELKTRNSDVLDAPTLWRYNAQLWLTWTMFSLTYPSVAERSNAYLVIVRPGTNTVTIRSCLRPSVTKTLRTKFPWINCLCPQVLNCLTPTCVNVRVQAYPKPGSGGRASIDPKDLCYRNVMFNREKARVRQRRYPDQGSQGRPPHPTPSSETSGAPQGSWVRITWEPNTAPTQA
uniref:Uncharacterized protein n=1 Tax=Oryzias latipes TaxID=8090 RepID=A0A286P9Q5_ORYLA|nr:hypothetical protein ORF60-like [Oryzias latipes]